MQKSKIELLDNDLKTSVEKLLDAGATEQSVADFINEVLLKDEDKAEETKANPFTQKK